MSLNNVIHPQYKRSISNIQYCFVCIGLLLFMFIGTHCFAKGYPLPKDKNIKTVGKSQVIYSEPGDTLSELAKRYHVSVRALKRANRSLPKKLKAWTRINIPGITLPSIRKGIVINRAENRLFYFPENDNKVWVFPVAVGRSGWETPLGTTKILDKRKDPVWYVPESIQIAAEEKGIFLPDVMRSSPHNPLGKFAMRTGLSKGTILIHGTNNPKSIGRSVSSGCIRMFNKDVGKLFNMVRVGTNVHVVEEMIDYYEHHKKPAITTKHLHANLVKHDLSEHVISPKYGMKNRLQ